MRLEVRDNVLLAYLDQPGSPVNTLGESLSADFETFLARLKSEPGIAGAVGRIDQMERAPRTAHRPEWFHQPARRQIVAHQRPHRDRHAQPLDRRLYRKIEAVESQPGIRVDTANAGKIQPSPPIPRPRRSVQQRYLCQIQGSLQRPRP